MSWLEGVTYGRADRESLYMSCREWREYLIDEGAEGDSIDEQIRGSLKTNKQGSGGSLSRRA